MSLSALDTMTRKQLYDEAKALGLPVRWATSTIVTLTDALRANRASSTSLGADASFEEQYDHLAKGRAVDLVVSLSRELRLPVFEERVAAALAYLDVMEMPVTLESLREASVLLVGSMYCRSHPLNPHESVERLRKAKRAILLDAPSARGRREILEYLSRWEAALTRDELILYLG